MKRQMICVQIRFLNQINIWAAHTFHISIVSIDCNNSIQHFCTHLNEFRWGNTRWSFNSKQKKKTLKTFIVVEKKISLL